MAKRRIFTVGFELPGDEFEYVDFDSDQTLLDADIVLFEPTLGSHPRGSYQTHNGLALLTEHSSFVVKKRLDHWKSEIVSAVNAGKLLIVYLAKPIEVFRIRESSATLVPAGVERRQTLFPRHRRMRQYQRSTRLAQNQVAKFGWKKVQHTLNRTGMN
jgi:hypothetical protein